MLLMVLLGAAAFLVVFTFYAIDKQFEDLERRLNSINERLDDHEA